MHKLKLNLEELAVESFAAVEEKDDGRGSVQAYGSYDEDTCFGNSCRRGTACAACPVSNLYC